MSLSFGFGPYAKKDNCEESLWCLGQIPEEKYPLVSRPVKPATKGDRVLTGDEWVKLNQLVNSDKFVRKETEDSEWERKRRETSMDLQRSWGQTGKVHTVSAGFNESVGTKPIIR